jgi:CheY-like chemotaxis protein
MGDTAVAESGRLDRARILLVEDNLINQEVAVEILGVTGARVEVAADGQAALAAAARTRHDVILMDVHLPGIDGYETTRRIRELEAGGACVPVIAMTAGTPEGERQACLDAGMNDFVAKPIQPDVLISCLERWLTEPVLSAETDTGRTPPGPAETRPPDEEAFRGIDMAAAMARLAGNRTLLERLLGELYRDYRDVESALFSEKRRAALRKGDVGAALEYLHTLKGIAGNLSAVAVHQACVDLERGLQSDEREAIDRLLSRLQSAMNELLRSAAACHARRQRAPAPQEETVRAPENPALLPVLMQELAFHLEKNSLRAEDTLARLKARLADRSGSAPDLSAELQVLSEQVADFAFQEARETLAKMGGRLCPDGLCGVQDRLS